MLHPNISRTRNAIILKSLQTAIFHCASNSTEPLQAFRHFQLSGTDPDEFAVSKALSLSANLYSLDKGKQIHTFLLKKNIPMDVVANNSLANMYFKCGSVGDAEKVLYAMPERDTYTWTVVVSGYAWNGRVKEAMASFEEMPMRDTVSWNSMMGGFQREGYNDMALELFRRMRLENVALSDLTFVVVLKACIGLKRLEEGRKVHCCVVKSACTKSSRVGGTLMDMYAKCGGDMLGARTSFEEIQERDVVSWSILLAGFAQNGRVMDAEVLFNRMPEKNLVSWNVMCSGYVQNGMQERAFTLFVEMMRNGMKPNCYTMTSLLSGCTSTHLARQGRSFHGYMLKAGLSSDTAIGNSMITMYGEQGCIGDARLVFDEMPRYDVVSWTAMLAAYICNNDVDEARHVFGTMPEKNLISWNTMMFGYLQRRRSSMGTNPVYCTNDDALMFFYDMERSQVRPDHFSYNCALTACANNGTLDQARAIHCRAMKRGLESDVGVGNALITAYGKCGSISEAEKIFGLMSSRDMISWNALLTGYSQNGRGHDVLNFYKEMRSSGLEPNHVTFISLLSACSYMGKVIQGREYFDEMERVHGISPSKEHYACLVDLLGRAGLLNEAESIIQKMPIEPDATVWGALLGACKMHGDPVIGKRAAAQIFRVEPHNSAAHVALAETFATSKMWEDVARVRSAIREKRLLKEPGCSWLDVRSQNHTFLSCDHSHQQNDHIHETLSSLYCNMMMEEEEEEYVPNTSI
ncbi:pentatricopeptide repeat-containing protein-like [Iris pallida]|uniref:Pentatricopeptide repeat-containing protein-like n=1 Tax=Iris pallida TaxID=29817 RepID=A0AAX6E9W3_IRIPA|nr:pentatricopeptide repeat-containing protein-like [Iris pallida]